MVRGSLAGARMGGRHLGEGGRPAPFPGAAQAGRRCLIAHLDRTPPLGFGNAVAREELAHAAIDLSDGLSGDLLAVCQESGVSAWVDGDTMPIDPGAAMLARDRGIDARDLALHGGEGYQLLLAGSVA